MTGLVALSLIGIGLGLVRGGSLAGWAHARVVWSPAALLALAVLLVLHNPPIDQQAWAMTLGPAVWPASLAVIVFVMLRNAWSSKAARAPWALAAVGVGLNFLVISVNGGFMPQSAEARVEVRGTRQRTDPHLRNVAPIDADSRLSWLGDVIAEPSWLPNANVISVGDVLLGCGLAWWAFAVTTTNRRRGLA